MAADASLADLDAQIAELVARRAAAEAEVARKADEEATRKRRVLAPGSPSPRKKARTDASLPGPQRPLPRTSVNASTAPVQDRLTAESKPGPSTFRQALEHAQSDLRGAEDRRAVKRSSTFAAAPAVREPALPSPVRSYARDDDLRLVEDLKPGPREFTAPADDPDWQQVEPNSRIRLKSRSTPHDILQDHLADRFHLSPSLLYSIVRPARSGTELEVPVDGDWIVIGALADKSPIRMTSASTASQPKAKSAEDETEDEAPIEGKGQALDDEDGEDFFGDDGDAIEQRKRDRKPKRYVTFKLVDLGRRGQTGGDDVLNVMLFEADSSIVSKDADADDVDQVRGNGVRVKRDARTDAHVNKTYHGGSGGAYERFWKESDGAVVAILNPKVLKPRFSGKPNASSNILSITPESAESVVVIGRAKDLGSCPAVRRDGQTCGAWVDKRVSEVCEWHVQQAVAKKRTGRSELMGGTSGLRLTTVGGRGGSSARGGGRGGKAVGFDRDKKTGLLPRDNRQQIEGVTTYVLPSANKASGGRPMAAFGRENSGLNAIAGFHASEAMGKRDKADGKARAKRREQEELSLARQLGKDSGKSIGARYLIAAGKQPKAVTERADGDEAGPSKPRVFSPSTVRRIGFDPTRPEGGVRAATNESAESKQKRLGDLAVLGDDSLRPEPKLNMPGGAAHRRSNLVDPTDDRPRPSRAPKPVALPSRHDDDDDDDLLILRDPEPEPSPPPRAPVASSSKARPRVIESDDDDEDETPAAPSPPRRKSKPVASPKRSGPKVSAAAKRFKKRRIGPDDVTAGADVQAALRDFRRKKS